ncbi:hypothetical protein D1B33_07625 [Lysinibacillus yapensis]|uniref:Uncharacterized protein n=1 Tax=Ureibacillus yapensis TaxID=2304605 RepID=A0A396SEY6_9BACL|nr:hypothetical protein D1B33_07625 [Lysinibacillus yapensis]
MDMLTKRKCLDDIRMHKAHTKKLRLLIASTDNPNVKKQLVKGYVWHIKSKRELKLMLIDDIVVAMDEDCSAYFEKLWRNFY